MPVKRDSIGRRSVEAEVAVSAIPEEVWQAIATGAGISAWFVPTRVDERVGGTIASTFGPGMDSLAVITDWQPQRSFVAESHDDMGPDGPLLATEWTIEPRDGGGCRVRVVHSWFAEKDTWDHQFERHTFGWRRFFRILKLYVERFSGQPAVALQLDSSAPKPVPEAWAALTRPLGLAGIQKGDRFTAPDGAPPLAGVVVAIGPPRWPEVLVLLEQPAPGVAHLFPMPMGRKVFLSVRFYFYGYGAAAAASEAEPIWRTWLDERLPATIRKPAAS